jgi:hypothetical protein
VGRADEVSRDLERLRPLGTVVLWIALSLPSLLQFLRGQVDFVTTALHCLLALVVALVAVAAMLALLRRYHLAHLDDEKD